MFRFTVYEPCISPEMRSWLDHFNQIGLGAGIVERSGRFSVWRSGKKTFDHADKSFVVSERLRSKDRIVAAVHGFPEDK